MVSNTSDDKTATQPKVSSNDAESLTEAATSNMAVEGSQPQQAGQKASQDPKVVATDKDAEEEKERLETLERLERSWAQHSAERGGGSGEGNKGSGKKA